MQNKIKYYGFKVKRRIKGLRLELKIILVVSTFSIITIEFFLNKYHADYQWQYDFGVIWLKLCYSYLSAFIFYYLVIYSARQRKIEKSHYLISNNISNIINNITLLLYALHSIADPGNKYKLDNNINKRIYTIQIVKLICVSIHPRKPVVDPFHTEYHFDNPYQLISYYIHRVKSSINELLVMYDFLNEPLLNNLTRISSFCNEILIIDLTNFGNTSLDIYYLDLHNLHIESKLLRQNKIKFIEGYEILDRLAKQITRLTEDNRNRQQKEG